MDYGPTAEVTEDIANLSTNVPVVKNTLPPPPAASRNAAPIVPSNQLPQANLNGPAPTGNPSLSIGKTTATAGTLFKEASYVGDNDEVDEDEWD